VIVKDKEGKWLTPLDIPEGKSGEVTIEHVKYPRGKPIMLVPMRTAFHRGEEPVSVTYGRTTRWHYLKENGGVWTTDLPCEIEQQSKLIAEMSGSVLVGGLGVGLITELLGRRDGVENILVVERNRDIVHLVWPHIEAPKARVRSVVVEDLFDYLARQAVPHPLATDAEVGVRAFDWAFYDIWTSDGAWTLYKVVWPLRRLTRALGVPDDRIVNWNEDVMRAQIRVGIASTLRMVRGVTQEDIDALPEQMRKHFSAFHRLSMADVEKKAVPPDHLWFWRTYFNEGFDRAADDAVDDLLHEYVETYGFAAWEERFGVLDAEVPQPSKQRLDSGADDVAPEGEEDEAEGT
jgi:hypothetical protein